MNQDIAVEKCKSFIDCQLQAAQGAAASGNTPAERPTITISRETGSGAHSVAGTLAEYLQAHDPKATVRWTVFDRNLVQKVLEDHHLPQRLAQYMPEKKVSEIDYAVEEILGLHPSMWTMVQHVTDTILQLAKMGNVILVGRGAVVIASKLKNAFHVRLVGSLEKRAAHVQEYHGLSAKDAWDFTRREDRQRRRYMKKYFGRKIEDPLLYHLIVNTDLVPYNEAARIIGDAVLSRWR